MRPMQMGSNSGYFKRTLYKSPDEPATRVASQTMSNRQPLQLVNQKIVR